MAEVISNILRVDRSLPKAGAVFSETLEFTGASDTTILVMPYQRIHSIAVHTTGNPLVYATAVPGSVLEESGTDMWVLWDGNASFANGVTAIKIDPNSSVGKIVVTVRADKG